MGKPQRIQRKRTKGWKMPEGAVYVGRPTKWGNPFRVEPILECETCGHEIEEGRTPNQAVALYRYHLTHPGTLHGWTMPTMDEVGSLRGKDLACWCPLGQPCHADVLLELANAEPK